MQKSSSFALPVCHIKCCDTEMVFKCLLHLCKEHNIINGNTQLLSSLGRAERVAVTQTVIKIPVYSSSCILHVCLKCL